jgi:sporulation protein YlmC with PRC-barrel domain
MALVGEVFVADVIGKPVLDPVGEEIGKLRDIAVVGGGPFPRAAGLLLERKKTVLFLPWEEVSIFNRRIISSRKRDSDLAEFTPAPDQLLIGKDLLDKQIVDIDGAKVVRVNDVKLAEEGGAACVTDVDVGVRGILRRLGVERRGETFFRTIRHPLRHQMISWSLIPPKSGRDSSGSSTSRWPPRPSTSWSPRCRPTSFRIWTRSRPQTSSSGCLRTRRRT